VNDLIATKHICGFRNQISLLQKSYPIMLSNIIKIENDTNYFFSSEYIKFNFFSNRINEYFDFNLQVSYNNLI